MLDITRQKNAKIISKIEASIHLFQRDLIYIDNQILPDIDK